MPIYKLGSSPLVHAPGLVAWAINAYRTPKDRAVVLRVVIDTWRGFPEAEARSLLMELRPYSIDGETVIVTAPGDPPAEAGPLAEQERGRGSR